MRWIADHGESRVMEKHVAASTAQLPSQSLGTNKYVCLPVLYIQRSDEQAGKPDKIRHLEEVGETRTILCTSTQSVISVKRYIGISLSPSLALPPPSHSFAFFTGSIST